MIGIHFTTYLSPKKLLTTLMSSARLSGYSWLIAKYLPLTDNSGITEGICSTSELKDCIDSLSTSEIAEYYCMFGKDSFDRIANCIPSTFDDFLRGSYKVALVCTDICLIDFYCKDMEILVDVRNTLIGAAICSDDEIQLLEEGNHGRTGFQW